MTKRIIIVTGQTATGKTSLALQLAQKYDGELINCDSRQVYKHLDIITGKEFSQKTKIWLYDIADPKDYFSSFDFARLTIPIIKKLLSEGKTPIIVGGTYFYLYHLLYGVETETIPPDWKLRKELEKKSVAELQITLKSLNPQILQSLNQSEKNNPQRLIRRIEIVQYQGRDVPTGQLYKIHNNVETGHAPSLPNKLNIPNLKIKFIGLKFKNKGALRKAIEKRVEKRLEQGAINEVKKLLEMGYKETDPGLKTIGYQQLIGHLRGVLNLQETINQWITKEIQYAKRQFTFMKRENNIRWREV